MRQIFYTITIFFLIVFPLGATNYFVSPTGNDGDDGLSETNAWLSLDNGDQTAVLQPGDTVNVLPGTYLLSSVMELTTSGTTALPVVYRNYGPGRAVFDANGNGNNIIDMISNHIVIDGLELTNTNSRGLYVNGDSSVITNCYIHHSHLENVRVVGIYNLFLRNVVAYGDEEGFVNEGTAFYSKYYGNTIYSNALTGIELQELTARIFNNILVLNNIGINGNALNICAYNDVWSNTTNNYEAGAVDSAGGLSVDPEFINPADNEFHLTTGSAVINAGLNLGYSYSGTAPEMGAFEYGEAGGLLYIDVIPANGVTEAFEQTQYTAYGYDINDSIISDLTSSVTWSTTDASGSITTDGLYTSGSTNGHYLINAVYGTLNDSAKIQITSGVSYVQIELYNGTLFGDTTLSTDNDTTVFYSRAYDSGDNLLGDVSVTWSIIGADSIGTVVAGPSSSTVLTVKQLGTGQVVAVESVTQADTTGTITATGGLPVSLVATPDSATVSADSTLQFYWESLDADGNISNPVYIPQWDVIGDIGTINSTTRVFTATTAGTGYIFAYGGELIPDTVGPIIVIPGDLKTIEVLPDSVELTTGGTQDFEAVGTDSDGNVTDAGTLTWEVIGGIGTIDDTGLFTPTSIGSGQIAVTSSIDGITDTNSSVIVDASILTTLEIEPDSAELSADSSLIFTVTGRDADSNIADAGTLTWEVIGGIGTIDATGLFSPTTAGSGQIAVTSSIGGVADTNSIVIINPGILSTLEIEPDSAELSADSSLTFTVTGRDADSNIADAGTLTWEVIGGIGTIDDTGLFTPTTAGSGQIAVTSSIGGVADTNNIVIVNPGALVRLEISPDELSVGLLDTIQFTATGYDSDDNPTDFGDITWKMLGRIGMVDTTGLFVAIKPGAGRVTAVSSINTVTDSSGYVEVEELYISTIPLGTTTVLPDREATILAFRIDNYFDVDKTVTGLTVRDASRGAGSLTERLTNIDSVALYLDLDNDSTLTVSDSLIAAEEYSAASVSLAFAPLNIPADSGKTFMVSVSTALYARDSDSLDIFSTPAVDVTTGDATLLAGPDTINSLGYDIIDGMIAGQVNITTTGIDTISPGDTVYPVLAFDLPRNGYSKDTLKIISFVNIGTVEYDDFDSLIVYRDDGDNIWEGTLIETRLGKPVFTGSQWTLSGLTVALEDSQNRFYLGAALSAYPGNGTTVAMSVPVFGIEVSSPNDGPLDISLLPVDTIVIQTTEAVEVALIQIAGRELIPGENSGALLSFRLTNSYADTVRIDSLRCLLRAEDPDGATQEQLDSQIDSLMLNVYLNHVENETELSSPDTILAVAHLNNGTAVFNTGDFAVSASGGVVSFSIMAGLNAQKCKNDNLLGVKIEAVTDIYFETPVTLVGDFPLQNDETFIINAFPATNIVVNTLEELTHFGGQINRVVFDFELPGNGYADDSLTTLELVNISVLEEARAIKKMNLWADLTGDGFTNDDILLGPLTFTVEGWEIRDLNCAVESTGSRFLVTIDVSLEQFKAGTLHLQIPMEGVGYASGMLGPDDTAITGEQTHLIFPSNRVTVISIPKPDENIYPGSSSNSILTFALYNSYLTQDQILQAMNLTNVSHASSGSEYADYEIGLVSMYFDRDKNRILNNDSLIATGYFTDGKLQLSGLNITLPPESLIYFFIVIDVPAEVIDSDSLMIAIAGASDFVFTGSVNVNGDLPLTRGGYLIFDGSVYSQYHIHQLTPRTISPGDTSVTLFVFQPACNGNQPDTLTALTILNYEDADTSDIAGLELWLDLNGDTLWQNTDSLLGSFGFDDSVWTMNSLEVEITADRPTLLVLGDINTEATPSVSFRGKIPVNGCVYNSANDGPLDRELLSYSTFPVSTSSMQVTCASLNETYSVGQVIEVRFTVTNTLVDSLDSVIGGIVGNSNPSIVTLSDSVAGPVALAGGESTVFYFTYTADLPGLVVWQIQAFAPEIPDSSVIIQTDTVMIQAVPENVKLSLINTIPTSVTKGQVNVFPMSLQIVHPDTLGVAAPIRIDSLILTMEDGNGEVLYADEAFSRLVLASGYSIVTVIEAVPHQSCLTMVFMEPVVISSGEENNFSLLVNIDSLATAAQFVISIAGADDIFLLDDNSFQTVTVDSTVVFPLKTAVCRIDEPSRSMMISYVSLLNETVNVGQMDVEVLQLRLRHPEEAGSSQIQLMSLSVQPVDSLLVPLQMSALAHGIAVKRQETIIGVVDDFEGGSDPVEIPLSMPVTLNPGESDSIIIQIWINNNVTYSNFGLTIEDSTTFVVRDLSSGASLEITTDTAMLATGSVFPILSTWAALKLPALPLDICLSSPLTGSVIGGRDSLPLIDIDIKYNVDAGHSSIILKDILVNVMDTLNRPLDPNRLFDRIGYRLSDNPVIYQEYVELIWGAASFSLGDTGLVINPGDSVSLQLVSDIEADAPFDHFVLSVQAENNIILADATDTTYSPGLILSAGCAGSFPFLTETVSIYLPAGRPLLTVNSQPIQTSTPGKTSVTLFDWNLSYETIALEGDLLVSSLKGKIYKRTQAGLEPVENPVFEVCYIAIEEEIVAWDSSLTGDSVVLLIDEGYTLSHGDNVAFSLKVDIKNDAELGNYLVRFADSTFLAVRDKNLLTSEYVIVDGGDYPLSSVEISLSPPGLGKSFSNYPNPFVPSRGEVTIIAFDLVEDAYVDIEIFSITGQTVKQVAGNSFRTAGSYQSDSWAGGNDEGLNVAPGTYFCRITARYVSGKEDSFRRKIAVIR